MARPKKTTTALVKASDPPKQGLGLQLPPGVRLPGVAVHTNPLIAVIACMQQEHVDDLGEEIAATENYLQGLKAIHGVVSQAFPKKEPAAEVAVEETPPPRNPGRPVEPATKDNGQWKGGRPKDPASPSGIALRMLRENIEATADDIIAEIRKANVSTASTQTLRSMISTKRWQVKNEWKAKNEKAAAPAAEAPKMKTRPMHTPLPSVTPPDEENDDAEGEESDEELDLRKEVAEFLFKRGLATNAEIMNKVGIPSSRINEFMRHEWFEYVTGSQQWRLTSKGKQDGLDY